NVRFGIFRLLRSVSTDHEDAEPARTFPHQGSVRIGTWRRSGLGADHDVGDARDALAQLLLELARDAVRRRQRLARVESQREEDDATGVGREQLDIAQAPDRALAYEPFDLAFGVLVRADVRRPRVERALERLQVRLH